MNNNKTGRDTLYKMVREEILKTIIARGIKPNEMLPSEGEIAKACSVSKMTSKLALDSLEQDGIIYRLARRGSFLSEIDISDLKKLLNHQDTAVSSSSIHNMLALIIPSVDSYTSDIIKFIEKEARIYSLSVVVKISDGILEREEELLLNVSKDASVAGIILFPGNRGDCGTALLNLKLQGYPIVIIDRVFKEVNFDSVCHDHLEGAKNAVDYLAKLGHEEIGFISSALSSVSSREERYNGFISAMMKNHRFINLNNILFIDEYLNNDFLNESNYVELLCSYLKDRSKATAIFCGDDYLAAALYYAAKRMDIDVPGKLSIIGFTDNQLLRYLPEQLTTVRQPVDTLAEEAVRLLVKKIDKPDLPPVVIKIPTELIPRKSASQLKGVDSNA